MTDPRVILGGDSRPKGKRGLLGEAPDLSWAFLRWVGFGLVVVGMSDLVLAWMPPHFGTAEWEFGIATATMENLPLTVVGLALILAAGLAIGSRSLVLVPGIVMGLIAVVVLVLGLLFALNVPLALRAVVQQPARLTLEKGMMKTAIQTAVYAVLLGWMCRTAIRHAVGRNS